MFEAMGGKDVSFPSTDSSKIPVELHHILTTLQPLDYIFIILGFHVSEQQTITSP